MFNYKQTVCECFALSRVYVHLLMTSGLNNLVTLITELATDAALTSL